MGSLRLVGVQQSPTRVDRRCIAVYSHVYQRTMYWQCVLCLVSVVCSSTNMSVSNVDENVWALTLLVVSIKRNVGGSPASSSLQVAPKCCVFIS